MKEQTLLRHHLLNKFEELPVSGNSVADWKKMEQALQIAMPLGLLSFVLFGKGWLSSKKLMWLWISIATCGGAATTLAVYQSREASLAIVEQQAKHQQNKPKGESTALTALKSSSDDSTNRVNKKLKTTKTKADTIGKPQKALLMTDTISPELKSKSKSEATDTSIRLGRFNLAGDSDNTASRLLKNALSARLLERYRLGGDSGLTSAEMLKKLNPVKTFKDSLVKPVKNLKPTKLFKDSLGTPVKNLKATKLLQNNFGKPVKKIKPLKLFKDSLIRHTKSLKPVKNL